MPNYDETEDLISYIKNNADKGIYSTFIGVGVDFNTELIEKISGKGQTTIQCIIQRSSKKEWESNLNIW